MEDITTLTYCIYQGRTPYVTYSYTALLYNILLLINRYIGINTTKCHSGSMSDNTDLTGVFHQKISSLPEVTASDSRYFQSS